MAQADHKYFQLLKKDVSGTLRESFPEVNESIEQWKGAEITRFQEDLIKKAGGRVSEKWFYTHIKSKTQSIPRIDILDLLSQYAGHSNWASYKLSNAKKIGNHSSRKRQWILLVFTGCIVLAIAAISSFFASPGSYQFCFVDVYSKKPILAESLEIVMLNEGESPYANSIDSAGCLSISSRLSSVRFVVRSPYYQTDTISRILNKGTNHESVTLTPDDYALMIRVFSNSDVDDWNTRRARLEEMMADNVKVYQMMYESSVAMEIYNKDEFINKLTMPIRSLRNIEILETVYDRDRIVSLRFVQVNDESDE